MSRTDFKACLPAWGASGRSARAIRKRSGRRMVEDKTRNRKRATSDYTISGCATRGFSSPSHRRSLLRSYRGHYTKSKKSYASDRRVRQPVLADNRSELARRVEDWLEECIALKAIVDIAELHELL